mmetsp:Transcript_70676/g.111892  ORF Transcript_70676/g.111892 Transcript_70676/m.111892 type:complete len:725 (+) Transcript_70676:38-2212(+)
MSIKRKLENEEVVDEEVDNGERFRGFIHDAVGDKMFVTCDGVPPEFADRPPKITKKSHAPAGLAVGSWITFNLLDEWPGENWGSLLAVDIEEAEPDPDEALTSAMALEAAEMQPRAKAPRKAPNGRGAPWPQGKGGKGGDRASLAAAAERLRAATANRTAPGKPAATAAIRRAPVQTRTTPVAAMAGADTGLTKSGAVAAFRQAREAGRHFDSGWSKTGQAQAGPAPKAWVKKNTLRGKVASTKALAPFQKVFLEAPEDLSAEDVASMEENREGQEISVEMPEQVLDAFPPIASFEDLQGILPDYAYQGLNAMGIEVPMPIQAQAIPMALAGLDVVGIAKTGSGKTLAYVLPALTHLEAQAPKAKGQGTPLALVLAPTRELAVQIADMAKAVTQFSGSGSNHPGGLSSAVLYGGGQGSKAWQVADVRNAGHLVAATPGRLLDVMDSSEVSLERVTFLVLDEADRMLECGFEEQVGRIGKTVRSDRQTLFFSATWPTQVQHMAQLMCSSDLPPVRILAGQRADGEGPTSREDILQEVVVFEQPTWEERDNAKQELLYAHLREVLSDESHKTLVFVSRKSLADTLANRLKSEGFRANVMHGGKSQDSRLATLEGFRNGEIQLLVTTDVMGRGLDIPGISHVVIYDMGDIEDYVHRIGRTARGPYGEGHALTFYEYDKKWPNLPRKLMDVLEQSGQEVPPELVALAQGGGQNGPVGIRKPQGWRSFR